MLFILKFFDRKIFRKLIERLSIIWVVVKEAITKRCFGIRVNAPQSL
jgi:hypothetical protein